MVKKAAVIFLALILLTAMTACDYYYEVKNEIYPARKKADISGTKRSDDREPSHTENREDISPDNSDDSVSNSDLETNTPEDNDNNEDRKPPKREDSQNGDVSVENTPSESQFSIGKIDGEDYKNPFYYIGCTLGSEWTYYLGDDISVPEGLKLNVMDGVMDKYIKTPDIIHDLYAFTDKGNLTISIDHIKLTSPDTDESGWIDNNLDNITQSFEAMDYVIISCKKVKLKFAGSERYAIRLHANYIGYDFYQDIIVSKKDGYICRMTLASYTNDYTKKLSKMFYSYRG